MEPLIYIPFTRLLASTLCGLGNLEVNFAPLHDEYAYGRFLHERWNEGKTFVNIEHDVEATEAEVRELYNCPRPWCSSVYNPGEMEPMFGCVKFSDIFIHHHPGLWNQDVIWHQCDVYLRAHAKMEVHIHGVVRHRHPL